MKRNPRQARINRHARIRAKVKGTPEKPRLCVFRSLNQISAQVIDDIAGNTLVAASSLESEVKGGKGKVTTATIVGKLVAKRAAEKGISQVVFDRGGYVYHGRIKALADGAREAGLKF